VVAIIKEDLCIGCEMCIDSYLSEAISMDDRKAKIDKDKCADCEICVDACLSEAIHME